MSLKPEFLADGVGATMLVDAYLAEFPVVGEADSRRAKACKSLRSQWCMLGASSVGSTRPLLQGLLLLSGLEQNEAEDFMNTVSTGAAAGGPAEQVAAGELHDSAPPLDAPAAKKQRGGRRVNKMPMLLEQREGLDEAYMKNYHHPASFYTRYPAVITSLAEEQAVIACLLGEIECVSGDAYPHPSVRKMVTHAGKLKEIGIGNPRDYGGKPKSWDVRRPPLPSPHPHSHVWPLSLKVSAALSELQDKVLSTMGKAHSDPESWGLTGLLGTGTPPSRGPTGLETQRYLGYVSGMTTVPPAGPSGIKSERAPPSMPHAPSADRPADAAVPNGGQQEMLLQVIKYLNPQLAQALAASGFGPGAGSPATGPSSAASLFGAALSSPVGAATFPTNPFGAAFGSAFGSAFSPIAPMFSAAPAGDRPTAESSLPGDEHAHVAGEGDSSHDSYNDATVEEDDGDCAPAEGSQSRYALTTASVLQAKADQVAADARAERERKKAAKVVKDATKKAAEGAKSDKDNPSSSKAKSKKPSGKGRTLPSPPLLEHAAPPPESAAPPEPTAPPPELAAPPRESAAPPPEKPEQPAPPAHPKPRKRVSWAALEVNVSSSPRAKPPAAPSAAPAAAPAARITELDLSDDDFPISHLVSRARAAVAASAAARAAGVGSDGKLPP